MDSRGCGCEKGFSHQQVICVELTDREKKPDADVVWHAGSVTREDRARALGQRGGTVWITGLPASGKSTLAFALEERLVRAGRAAYVLDGDNIRHGLNANLGFSPEHRAENIRRIGEVARLFADAGIIVIAAFVSPYRADRERVRAVHDAAGLPFIEVYLETPVEVCERRDPKGMYARARAGAIANFTGVSDPYEAPERAELTLNSGKMDVGACAAAVEACLRDRGIVKM